MSETERYDAVVIGAGISGVIFMAYARARGLRCIAFEKQSDVGGLWNRLPEWQDIQNRKEDFAINGVPLEGVRQPDIHEHVSAWVERYDLAPFMRLGCEVESVSREDGSWHVRTSEGSLRADYVIAATGVQNEPWIPDVHRLESEVVEKHSSALREPEELAGRRVTVVHSERSQSHPLGAPEHQVVSAHVARQAESLAESPRAGGAAGALTLDGEDLGFYGLGATEALRTLRDLGSATRRAFRLQ
jgi:thioredoxin reductase